MSMAILFLSFLGGALFQLSPANLFWKRIGTLVLLGIQTFFWWKLFSWGDVQVLNVGNWPHYAGIVWISDFLSLLFSALVIVLFFPTYLFLLYKKPEDRWLHAFVHFLAASLLGAFFTGDLFNLFVMFEVLLLSSYTFFTRAQKLSSGKLFIWSNIFGSALFLIAIAYLYKSCGTVNLADISVRFQSLSQTQASFLYWIFGFIFLFKAGIWPLYLWMPSSYPGLSPGVLSFFAVLSSKVGLYAFVRWTTLVGEGFLEEWRLPFQILCSLTIILTLAAAFTAKNLRSSLVYWSFSHTALMLLGFSLPQPLGLSGLLLYVLQDVFVTAALFYFCDAHEDANSPRQIFERSPQIAFIFLILSLSASGFPLSSAFWPKIIWIKAASMDQTAAFFMILLSAFLFLALSISIWNRYFVGEKKSPSGTNSMRLPWQVYYCLILSIICIGLSLFQEKVIVARTRHILNVDQYVENIQEATQKLNLRQNSSGVSP